MVRIFKKQKVSNSLHRALCFDNLQQFLIQIREYSLRNTCLKVQPSHLFIGVAMETAGCCDIESIFIDAAVDAASICQVLVSLVNSKINYEFLSDLTDLGLTATLNCT